MATAKNNQVEEASQPVNFDDLVKSASKLAGHDLLDKAELVDVPFIIVSVMFKLNDAGTQFAYVTGVNGQNQMFEFNDSSVAGVRQQLIEYVHETTGNQISWTSGEVIPLSLYAPKGLRCSTWERDTRPNKNVGKPNMQTVRTYYISKGSL
jgi:hypothetical protein